MALGSFQRDGLRKEPSKLVRERADRVGRVDGKPAVRRLLRRVRAALDQRLHYSQSARLETGQVEWRAAGVVQEVWVSAVFYE